MPQSVITPQVTPTKSTFTEAKEHTPEKLQTTTLATSSPKSHNGALESLTDKLAELSTELSQEGQHTRR
jgi:hypothetical protein